jgi:pyrroline-5-carboxylate reductase
LAEQADETPERLRVNVTSKGGTTAAALAVLMDEQTGLAQLMRRAVNAAADRSRELGE